MPISPCTAIFALGSNSLRRRRRRRNSRMRRRSSNLLMPDFGKSGWIFHSSLPPCFPFSFSLYPSSLLPFFWPLPAASGSRGCQSRTCSSAPRPLFSAWTCLQVVLRYHHQHRHHRCAHHRSSALTSHKPPASCRFELLLLLSLELLLLLVRESSNPVVVRSSPSMLRLRLAVERLRCDGHEVLDRRRDQVRKHPMHRHGPRAASCSRSM